MSPSLVFLPAAPSPSEERAYAVSLEELANHKTACFSLSPLQNHSPIVREDVVLMTEKELLQIWKWGY